MRASTLFPSFALSVLVFAACMGPLGPARAAPPIWLPAPAHPMPPHAIPVLLTPAITEPGLQCREAIRTAERAAGIPTQLMAAIGRIESGRPDAQGVYHPWPWTINAEGQGHFYASKAEAIAAVQALQARGVRSIDVGCMQVNLMHHPNAFASLDEAFDPPANAAYAARFLITLHAQSNNWDQATADYHSATPDIGADYQRKVAAVLPEERNRAGLMPAAASGNVWSTNVWSANMWNTAGQATPPAAARAGGGNMLSNNASSARIIPAAPGTVGRSLQAYRATPVSVTSRLPPRAPL